MKWMVLSGSNNTIRQKKTANTWGTVVLLAIGLDLLFSL